MSDRIYRNSGREPKQQILTLVVAAIISGVIILCVGSTWVSYYGW